MSVRPFFSLALFRMPRWKETNIATIIASRLIGICSFMRAYARVYIIWYSDWTQLRREAIAFDITLTNNNP